MRTGYAVDPRTQNTYNVYTTLERRDNNLKINNKNQNSAEGGVAPAGAKVTGATIRTWLLNKLISFLAVLSCKSDKNYDKDYMKSGCTSSDYGENMCKVSKRLV